MIEKTTIKNILTRSSGYLKGVCSHSLQPYRGCTFGNSLCGVACYVQHNRFLTRNAPWGSFLDVRLNAAESYQKNYQKEKNWAHKQNREFSIFMSSSTDPFLPQEDKYKITQSLLEVMLSFPPDLLILQTHSHRVTKYLDLYRELSQVCQLRIHLSIESDLERLPGLPPPASPVAHRLEAAHLLKKNDLKVVVTVSPLFPIQNPQRFFHRIGEVACGVVFDHFIGGDGSANGSRTLKTALPEVMKKIDSNSVSLVYQEKMVDIARTIMPGRVGTGTSGFAGQYF